MGGPAQRAADAGATVIGVNCRDLKTLAVDTATFERLEAGRKAVQVQTQELQARRNQLSKEVGQAKAKKKDASALIAEVNAQADKLKALEPDLARLLPLMLLLVELLEVDQQTDLRWKELYSKSI